MQKTRIVQIRSKLANFPNFLRLVRQDGEQMSGKKATPGFFTLFTGVVQKSFVKLVFKLFFEMFLFNVLFKPCIILECKNLPQNEGCGAQMCDHTLDCVGFPSRNTVRVLNNHLETTFKSTSTLNFKSDPRTLTRASPPLFSII